MNNLSRRDFVRLTGIAGGLLPLAGLEALAASGVPATQLPSSLRDDQQWFFPPRDVSKWPEFRKELHAWRADVKKRIAYDSSLYDRPDFNWVSSCYSCCFLMLNDQRFYDPVKGYTVDSFLDEAEKEFGGYDGMVLWHAYPRIGVDERNQFDLYREMPGGLEGLKTVTRKLHERGVNVFIDYNPWDQGTRREGKDDMAMVIAIIKAIDADGIFLDTMQKGETGLRDRLDAARRGVILEGEGTVPLENISENHMSWAQYFHGYHGPPPVLRNKWLERRHIQHHIKRFEEDHTSELHAAWMNGSGMMVWENVFGTWVGWSPRDKSILRSMRPIQRRYSALFSGEDWTPFIETGVPHVYGNHWGGNAVGLYTLVNRSERAREGVLLRLPEEGDRQYFDLITGKEIRPDVQGGQVLIRGRLRPRDIGGIICGSRESLGADFFQFLKQQARLYSTADFDRVSPPVERRYPWGSVLETMDGPAPTYCNNGQTGGTTPVREFPKGKSQLGFFDLCGNTWEWTESERTDGRTRFSIIRGGSWFRPLEAGKSDWYVDHGAQPCNHAVKLLLMWPGLDRCSTIGFRCAADLEEDIFIS